MQQENEKRRLLTVEPVLLCVYLTSNLFSTDMPFKWIMVQLCASNDYAPKSKMFNNDCDELDLMSNRTAYNTYFCFGMLQCIMLYVIPPVIGILLSYKCLWNFRRKSFIIAPLIGQLRMWATLFILCSTQIGYPLLTILATLFSTATGGFVVTVAACLCYVVDDSTPETSVRRFGLCTAAEVLSKLITTVLDDSFIYRRMPSNSYGYSRDFSRLFLVCAASVVCALVYTVWFLPELNTTEEETEDETIQALTIQRDVPKNKIEKVTVVSTVILAAISSIMVSGEESELYRMIRREIGPGSICAFFLAYYCMSGAWTAFGVWTFYLYEKIRNFHALIILFTVIGMSGVLGALASLVDTVLTLIVTVGIGSLLMLPSVFYKSFIVSSVETHKATAVSRIVFSEGIAVTIGPKLYECFYGSLPFYHHGMPIFFVTTALSILGLAILGLIHTKQNSHVCDLVTTPRTEQLWPPPSNALQPMTSTIPASADEKLLSVSGKT